MECHTVGIIDIAEPISTAEYIKVTITLSADSTFGHRDGCIPCTIPSSIPTTQL